MTLRNSNGYTCQCSFGLVNRLPIEKTLKIIFPTHIFPDMDGTRWYIVSRNFQVIFSGIPLQAKRIHRFPQSHCTKK